MTKPTQKIKPSPKMSVQNALKWALKVHVGLGIAKHVLIAMAYHSNGRGEYTGGHKLLQKQTESSQATVTRGVEHLMLEGIVISERSGGHSRYIFNREYNFREYDFRGDK
jgi:hypothetical protein